MCESGCFENTHYTKATLYVPLSAKAAYQAPEAWTWKSFTNIVEIDLSAIEDIDAKDSALNPKATAVYDLSGKRIASPRQGFNIVRYSNGVTKKVLVK